ncbi:velvet factor-domain-containing protein [Pterulicium gracile]|uniref:Velvet factor-domain-containing protein n=1 Tax=Pterulicium gracile TaxID=1884261 RepID=A0A5C3QNL7_9AGAR|nr:velvet factor-domain-containing protein [Pterula gracilis]
MRASSQPSTHSSRRSNHAFTTLRIVHFQVKVGVTRLAVEPRRGHPAVDLRVTLKPTSIHQHRISRTALAAHLGLRFRALSLTRRLGRAFPRQGPYHLEVVQQPLKTAEFRNAFLSRLPLTPPVVVRLTLRDTMGNICPVPELEVPFLVAHASLYSSDGLMPLDVPAQASGRASLTSPRLLYGELVATAELLEDLQGNVGCFFIFSDISVRWRGQFQLGISLMNLAIIHRGFGNGSTIAHTRTGTFEVEVHKYGGRAGQAHKGDITHSSLNNHTSHLLVDTISSEAMSNSRTGSSLTGSNLTAVNLSMATNPSLNLRPYTCNNNLSKAGAGTLDAWRVSLVGTLTFYALIQ